MALLGSILVDKEMMSTVSEIVQPSDFYASLHESIFLALFALYERCEPLDKVSLAEELKNRGMLDKIGGMAYLSSLMDTVPTAASAEYYARIVREKSSLRRQGRSRPDDALIDNTLCPSLAMKLEQRWVLACLGTVSKGLDAGKQNRRGPPQHRVILPTFAGKKYPCILPLKAVRN
jgi:hypothetical protein